MSMATFYARHIEETLAEAKCTSLRRQLALWRWSTTMVVDARHRTRMAFSCMPIVQIISVCSDRTNGAGLKR